MSTHTKNCLYGWTNKIKVIVEQVYKDEEVGDNDLWTDKYEENIKYNNHGILYAKVGSKKDKTVIWCLQHHEETGNGCGITKTVQ